MPGNEPSLVQKCYVVKISKRSFAIGCETYCAPMTGPIRCIEIGVKRYRTVDNAHAELRRREG